MTTPTPSHVKPSIWAATLALITTYNRIRKPISGNTRCRSQSRPPPRTTWCQNTDTCSAWSGSATAKHRGARREPPGHGGGDGGERGQPGPAAGPGRVVERGPAGVAVVEQPLRL